MKKTGAFSLKEWVMDSKRIPKVASNIRILLDSFSKSQTGVSLIKCPKCKSKISVKLVSLLPTYHYLLFDLNIYYKINISISDIFERNELTACKVALIKSQAL